MASLRPLPSPVAWLLLPINRPAPPAALQVKEELAAAEARRPAVIVVEPALHLELAAALQQPPPRLDMCSACAQRIQKVSA